MTYTNINPFQLAIARANAVRRNASASTTTTGATTGTTTGATTGTSTAAIQHPDNEGLDQELLISVQGMLMMNSPENTRNVIAPKMAEFMEFCHACYPNEVAPLLPTAQKFYRFMWYLAAREKKPTGGRRRNDNSTRPLFNKAEYDLLTSRYFHPGSGENILNFPIPEKPVSPAVFSQYKAALRQYLEKAPQRTAVLSH